MPRNNRVSSINQPYWIVAVFRSNRVGSPVYSNSKCIKSWLVDGAYAVSFGSSSSGVPNPGTFRGRSLSSVSILWRSAWVISEKSVPFWIVETHQAFVVLNSTFFPAVVRGVKIALRSQFRSDFLVLGKLKAIVKSDRVHLIPREQLDDPFCGRGGSFILQFKQLSQTTFALVGTQNVSTTIVAADQINLPIAVASALIYDFWTMLNANSVGDLKPSTTTRFASVMTRLRFFFKRCRS